VVKLSHIESTLWLLWKESAGDILIVFLGIFWKKSQWVAQVHNDYIVNKIMKETRGFFQKVATGYIVTIIVKESRVFIQKVATDCFAVFFVKVISMYLLFTFWSKWWIHFKKTQHISTSFWLDKLLKKSQLNHNVSTDYIPPCPQCIRLKPSRFARQLGQRRILRYQSWGDPQTLSTQIYTTDNE